MSCGICAPSRPYPRPDRWLSVRGMHPCSLDLAKYFSTWADTRWSTTYAAFSALPSCHRPSIAPQSAAASAAATAQRVQLVGVAGGVLLAMSPPSSLTFYGWRRATRLPSLVLQLHQPVLARNVCRASFLPLAELCVPYVCKSYVSTCIQTCNS
eukprot:scaffold20513_cov33-Tisochrysis_lutea.AAC.5